MSELVELSDAARLSVLQCERVCGVFKTSRQWFAGQQGTKPLLKSPLFTSIAACFTAELVP